jgi:hypothetical protein
MVVALGLTGGVGVVDGGDGDAVWAKKVVGVRDGVAGRGVATVPVDTGVEEPGGVIPAVAEGGGVGLASGGTV